MQTVGESLFARSTTIFGVCEALGEDFGVSPTWFRVLFAAGVLFNLEYAIAAYAVAGALVLISRFAYPDRRAAAPAVEAAAPADTAHIETAPAPVPAMAEAA
jgi:phage shock protein PspC (stress-responsive transcriptional regulator)